MDAKTVIQQLGGPSAAARFFECKPAAVSQWKRNNRIPNARLLHLKAARPDLYSNPDDGLPRLVPAQTVEERRVQDQRVADRRIPDIFETSAIADDEKAA